MTANIYKGNEMNLYTILSSKPHNLHYLLRYIKFINLCTEHNKSSNTTEYMEKHHICPKSVDMFPEYKCFKTHPQNRAILTYRQHVIAHMILWKTFNNISQALSLLYTSGQYHTKNLSIKSINSKWIEAVKKDVSIKRKGIFTRGYDDNGNPLVSESTRQKISLLKIAFYKDPENRKNNLLHVLVLFVKN